MCHKKKQKDLFDSGNQNICPWLLFVGISIVSLHFRCSRRRPRLIRCSAFVVAPSTVPSSLPPAVFARRGRPGSCNGGEDFPRRSVESHGSYDLNMYVGWLVSWQFRRDILKKKQESAGRPTSRSNAHRILLMEEILHQLISSLSHYLQGFIHPRWCRISSINRMTKNSYHTRSWSLLSLSSHP